MFPTPEVGFATMDECFNAGIIRAAMSVFAMRMRRVVFRTPGLNVHEPVQVCGRAAIVKQKETPPTDIAVGVG
jgi:hypothetical protein